MAEAMTDQAEVGAVGAISGVALRLAVIKSIAWRSGSQIVAQLATWATTFLVLRLLSPADYGRYAMTASVTTLLAMLSGASFANGLVRQPHVAHADLRRMLGLLIVLNGGIAAAQWLIAPLVAAYYRQPLLVDLLRVQCLLYAANPPLALASAMLSRRLEFKAQALANFASALVGAGTALAGGLLGWGVWTLVAAPIAMVCIRALGYAMAARLWLAPSFAFRGMAGASGFGAVLVLSQLIWFVQTQADVFIGGRLFSPALLGLYTTALFLAQMLTAKFIPPINEVAFSAYARVQHDRPAVARAFLHSVGLIMLVVLPFYAGMALTAQPLVAVVLGPHWADAVPLVRVLACAMPFVALQIMFAPVTNALGRPWLSVQGALAGAVIMPLGFLIGGRWGLTGMAESWLVGFPLLALFNARISAPTIGIRLSEIAGAIRPAAAATGAMVLAVSAVEPHVAAWPGAAHLAALVAIGAMTYVPFALFLRPDLLRLRGNPFRVRAHAA